MSDRCRCGEYETCDICVEEHRRFQAVRNPTAIDYSHLSDNELNKLIAERIFGLTKLFKPTEAQARQGMLGDSNCWHYIPSGKPPRTHMIDARAIPYFASDITAAMSVVEKMREQGLTVILKGNGSRTNSMWRVLICGKNETCADHESLPRAICFAALACVEDKG